MKLQADLDGDVSQCCDDNDASNVASHPPGQVRTVMM